jgi:hypothetical protein
MEETGIDMKWKCIYNKNLKALNQILEIANENTCLWNDFENNFLEIYFGIPDPNTGALIGIKSYSNKLTYWLQGSWFSGSYKEGASPEETAKELEQLGRHVGRFILPKDLKKRFFSAIKGPIEKHISKEEVNSLEKELGL